MCRRQAACTVSSTETSSVHTGLTFSVTVRVIEITGTLLHEKCLDLVEDQQAAWIGKLHAVRALILCILYEDGLLCGC